MKCERPILITSAIGGCVGLFSAIVLSVLNQTYQLSSTLIMIFWPTAILGFGFNGSTSLLENIAMALIVFGGNAIVYAGAVAAIAWLVSSVVDYIRHFGGR